MVSQTDKKSVPDDTIRWQITRDENLRHDINETSFRAQIDNIKAQRSLIITFVTLSAGIIGFTIPVIGKADLVKNSSILVAGLFLFLILIVFSLGYLKFILEKENRALVEQQDKYNDHLTKHNEGRDKFFDNPNAETLKEWTNTGLESFKSLKTNSKTNPDYSLDVIFALFITSLGLLVISLVDFNFY